jgi:hypothetical protein
MPCLLLLMTENVHWLQVRAAPGHVSEVHILFRDLQGAAAAQRALNGAFIPSLTGAQPCAARSATTPTEYPHQERMNSASSRQPVTYV